MSRLLDALLAGWVRAAAWWIPRGERGEWLEGWQGELAATRRRGVPWDRRLGLAAGALVDAIHYRFEETSMEGWRE